MQEKNNFFVKRTLLFIAFLTATVLWTMVIFVFSSADGSKSSSQSHTVTEHIVRVFDSDYKIPDIPEEGSIDSIYDNIVRKTAHVSEYAFLAVLWYFTVLCVIGTKKRRCVFSCLFSVPFCVATAAADEINQYFTDGRTGCLADVLVDSTGVLIGSALCILIVSKIIKKIDQK